MTLRNIKSTWIEQRQYASTFSLSKTDHNWISLWHDCVKVDSADVWRLAKSLTMNGGHGWGWTSDPCDVNTLLTVFITSYSMALTVPGTGLCKLIQPLIWILASNYVSVIKNWKFPEYSQSLSGCGKSVTKIDVNHRLNMGSDFWQGRQSRPIRQAVAFLCVLVWGSIWVWTN